MNYFQKLVAGWIVLSSFGCCGMFRSALENAALNGAYAKIVTTVVDEDGAPIPNARVRYRFGMIDEKKSTVVIQTTDSAGVASADELTGGHYISIEASHPDYYTSSEKLCFVARGEEHEVKWRRWMPQETNVNLALRRRTNPIDLHVRSATLLFPTTNEWFALDAERCDWVKPYGKGEIGDVEFRFTWNGEMPTKFKEQLLEMRFPEYPNGGLFVPRKNQSAFPDIYSAPTNLTYRQNFTKKKIQNGDCSNMMDGTFDFPFRIRSVTNSVGEIVSCTYGRFLFMDFSIHFNYTSSLIIGTETNPTPLDNNLERKTK